MNTSEAQKLAGLAENKPVMIAAAQRAVDRWALAWGKDPLRKRHSDGTPRHLPHNYMGFVRDREK